MSGRPAHPGVAGRGIGRPAARRMLLLWGLLAAAALVGGRGFQLQIVEREHWTARALEQQRQRHAVPAPRGAIYDRNGVALATSRETYRIAVAPRELGDPDSVALLLERTLGLSSARARRAVSRERRWTVLPGRYGPAVRERLAGTAGIHFERTVERSYPQGDLALELLGRVSVDGQVLSGLELEFDTLLAGSPGMAVVRRDARGEPIPGAAVVIAEPIAGHDLHLSLDVNLQEIADDALRSAIAGTGAAGGDLVFLDPATGEILAAASRRRDGMRRWTSVTDPYEPGSTLKPFLMAALLAEDRASLADTVDAGGGIYVRGARTIRDVGRYGRLSVRDALRLSSNVAMVKLSDRLSRAEQYRYLRDFGFGTPTRVPYPSEAGGLLRRPADWSGYSQASLAMGYEILVTPLQVALAYGALANGGELMQPLLVREIRSPAGVTVRRSEPRVQRRVVPREVAAALAEVLGEAVESGTGREAGLGVFRVAGKTGTARRTAGGAYQAGAYVASFAGFFPVINPQVVFVVKLDRPTGEYYGGRTAAPVTRSMLAAALAARHSPLDRQAVFAATSDRAAQHHGAASPQGARRSSGGADAAAAATPPAVPFILAVNGAPELRRNGAVERPVPDVTGLPVREAAMRLHARGFRVEVQGSGWVHGTEPAAGREAADRSTVEVRARERHP